MSSRGLVSRGRLAGLFADGAVEGALDSGGSPGGELACELDGPLAVLSKGSA